MKFLEIEEIESKDHDTVCMTSYPRSGNTLLRAYLEKIMGLCSGSDSDITKKLNKDLMMMGLAGESLVDKRVMIIKTHYPERYGKTMHYADRAILLMRNPVDCITSLYHMVATGTHNLSMSDENINDYPQMFSEFVQQEAMVWRDFHDYWLKVKIPKYIVRFEDLVKNPEPTLMGLLAFIMNVETIEGTLIHKYLKLAVGEASPQIYKPRQGKAAGNYDKFDQVHKDFVAEYCYKHLRMFGFYETYLQHGANPVDDKKKAKVEKEIPDIDNFIAK